MFAETSDESLQGFDLAVIGAGIYGIQAARTYLELHQNDRVIVFEASGHVGGVWSPGKRIHRVRNSLTLRSRTCLRWILDTNAPRHSRVLGYASKRRPEV